MMTKKLLLSFVLAGCVCVFGCSDKVPLGGTVTFSDDGTPLTTGAVFFETPTYRAQGDIRADGTYTVGSETLTDGIPKGTYGISIRYAEEVTVTERPDGTSSERRRDLIDAKYRVAETSGLTFTVDGTNKKFDIQVDRAQ